MAVLKNVRVSWACVLEPNRTFTPAWEVKVHMNAAQAKALQDEAKSLNKKGLNIKKEGDDEYTFRFKRNISRADGTENRAPVVVGQDGKTPFKELIGNDSICNIQYGLVAYTNKFGSGVTSDLKGVMVVKHVPYTGGDGSEFASLAEEEESPRPSTFSDDEYDEDFN